MDIQQSRYCFGEATCESVNRSTLVRDNARFPGLQLALPPNPPGPFGKVDGCVLLVDDASRTPVNFQVTHIQALGDPGGQTIVAKEGHRTIHGVAMAGSLTFRQYQGAVASRAGSIPGNRRFLHFLNQQIALGEKDFHARTSHKDSLSVTNDEPASRFRGRAISCKTPQLPTRSWTGQ